MVVVVVGRGVCDRQGGMEGKGISILQVSVGAVSANDMLVGTFVMGPEGMDVGEDIRRMTGISL